MHQRFFKVRSNLGGLQGDSFIIEMHVVAVIFGMAFTESVEVVDGNSRLVDEFKRNGVANSDALV